MKKTLRNLVIGAVVTAGIFATSTAALAAGTQFVQNDMNFRNGPSTAATIIGSVPAGAQVEVIDLQNGWNLVRPPLPPSSDPFRQARRSRSSIFRTAGTWSATTAGPVTSTAETWVTPM